MIIFHEGLPRSGKSYEAMVERIIPALQAGRGVLAYIEGLDHEKIAIAASLEVAQVRRLLRPLTLEQVESKPRILRNGDEDKKTPPDQPLLDHIRDNDLIIIDEAQDFWGTKAKLSAEFTKFVTQHGHRGLDIILMGQHLADVHPLFRRRVETKLVFIKLNAIGAEQRYSVTSYKQVDSKWKKVTTKVGKYEPRYFGTYKSHVSSEIQTGNYKEKRSTVWSSPLMRFGVPIGLLVGVLGFVQAWKFFHPAPMTIKAASVAKAASAPASVQRTVTVAQVAPAAEKTPAEVLLTDNSKKYRIRLAGTIRGKDERFNSVIEWIDGASHVMERLTINDLREMGVAVMQTEGFTLLRLGEFKAIATAWPMTDSSDTKVSQAKLDELKGQSTPLDQRGAVNLGGRSVEVPKVAGGADPGVGEPPTYTGRYNPTAKR